MADQDQNHPQNNSNSQQEGTGSQDPSFGLQRTYIKDLSLEMPNAPQIFLEQEGPNVEEPINDSGQALADTVFDCTATGTILTQHERRPARASTGQYG